MIRRQALFLIVAGFALLGISGCKTFKARQAIRKYSEKISVSNAKLAQVNDAVRKINSRLATKAIFAKHLDTMVLPRWDAYITALKAVPTGTDELKKIHEIMIASHGGMYDAWKKMRKEITDANYVTRYNQMQTAELKKARDMEKKYQAELSAYYKQHGVQLKN